MCGRITFFRKTIDFSDRSAFYSQFLHQFKLKLKNVKLKIIKSHTVQIVHSSSGKCLMRPRTRGTFWQPNGFIAYQDCISPPDLSQMFVMTKDGVIMTDESACLDASERETFNTKPQVKLIACSNFADQKWKYDEEVHKLTRI